MGVFGDIWDGITGHSNAHINTPVNSYQATDANLGQQDYATAIQQAQQAQQNVGQQQGDFAQALRDQLAGRGPNLAQEQLRAATQQNAAMAAGAIGSQRGMNPALQAKLILDQQANANQQAAGQSAMLRAQQQSGTQAMLAQALAAQRGQDLQGQGLGQQGLQGQNALNLQNHQGTQQINAGVAGQNAGLDLAAQQGNAQIAGQNAAGLQHFFGGLLSGAGSAASMAGSGSGGADTSGLIVGYDGGEVPGHAEVEGNSIANDKVHALLSPKEIVLPRSVTTAPDAPDKAAAFVAAIRKRSGGGAGKGGYGAVLAAHRALGEQLKALGAK